MKVWTTHGECKFTVADQPHTDWISCVRFSPSAKQPQLVSAGWDKMVKVWTLADCRLRTDLAGHTGTLNTVTISPDGSLCASGGKDATAMLWDVNDSKHLYSLDAGSTINALTFSPKNYWLCAATDNSVKIWDLENKTEIQEILPPVAPTGGLPWCVSISWSPDGQTLFVGATDGKVYVANHEMPPEGTFAAFMVDVRYDKDPATGEGSCDSFDKGLPEYIPRDFAGCLEFTSEVSILPVAFPFDDCVSIRDPDTGVSPCHGVLL